MGIMSSMKKGFQEAAEAKTQSKLDNFEYKKTELENKIKDAKVNHILHLILSIITAGIWIIVWFFVSMSKADERKTYRRELKELYELKNKYDSKKNEKPSKKNMTQTDELYKLSELLDKGHISKEEFNSQKEKLLS